MKKKKMLFETVLRGHRMEYIHHIYMGMLSHKDEDYVIVVAEEFNDRKSNYDWPQSNNIIFDFIPQSEANDVNNGNLLNTSWKKTRLLRKYVKKYNPHKTFLITLIGFIPFLPFLIPSTNKIVAIVYKIYLYEWKQYSFLRKITEVVKYTLMTWGKCIDTIFILNDEGAAIYLNKLYGTTKFHYLTDPYNEIDYKPKDIRKELKIPTSNLIYLHFGGLQERKGTIEILKAISMLDTSIGEKKTFIFAGLIYDKMRKSFYKELENAEKGCQVLVFDNYCKQEFLQDLCYTCDYILIPYQVTAQSSGLLGYAAHFGKPVIGPCHGLIGKLIKKNHLGFTIPNIKASDIASCMRNGEYYIPGSRYLKHIEVKTFTDHIFKHF